MHALACLNSDRSMPPLDPHHGLYAKACEFDLVGIVAKWKDGSYIADDRRSSWVKIKNPNYSQIEGREELFERP
jgi:hypothetical protein